MNIYLLYALLPLVIFPLTSVFLTQVSRKTGSILTTFLRQVVLLVFGIPIIFFTPDFFSLLWTYWKEVFISGLFGCLYLLCVFKSYDYVEIVQWRVINVVSRILFSLLVGILILGEVLNIYQAIGVVIMLAWISLYLKIKNENILPKYNLPLGVAINILGAVFFVANGYYFSIYAKEFSPFMAGYILEISSIPLLMAIVLCTDTKNDFWKILDFSCKDWKLLLLWSVPALFGSYGLAQSYKHLDFIIVNILFCATLVMAGVFSYLILGEKLTKLQMFIFSCILIGIFIVNYF